MFRRAPRAKAKSRSGKLNREELLRRGGIRYARFPGVGMTAVAVIGKAAIGHYLSFGGAAKNSTRLPSETAKRPASEVSRFPATGYAER